MKHFICLAIGLLMACTLHASDDVGMTYEQPKVTTSVCDLAVPAVPVIVGEYTLTEAPALMYVCCTEVSQVLNFQLAPYPVAAVGRAGELLSAPCVQVRSSMVIGRFVPPNITLSDAKHRNWLTHYRNYGHNH